MRRAVATGLLALGLVAAAPVAADPPAPPGPGVDAIPAPPSVEARVAEIRRRVREAVVYPDAARRRGITGVTRIRFAVDASGRAAEVETVDTSGHAILDRAAEQGARDAADLPYVYGRLEMPIRFALSGGR